LPIGAASCVRAQDCAAPIADYYPSPGNNNSKLKLAHPWQKPNASTIGLGKDVMGGDGQGELSATCYYWGLELHTTQKVRAPPLILEVATTGIPTRLGAPCALRVCVCDLPSRARARACAVWLRHRPTASWHASVERVVLLCL